MPDPDHTARNVYVHVPFCSGKCTYCAFYSEPFSIPRADRFLSALETEIEAAAAQAQAPRTIYIGGGTPSLLTTAQWNRLCRVLRETLAPRYDTEWTVEANPGTITLDTATQWKSDGVNRVSLGVQSMQNDTLARINRRHDAQQTADTVTLLQQAGFTRIGMDLIACLPGVSDAEWRETLSGAIALQPGHISIYACSIERGTALAAAVDAGHCRMADANTEAKALDLASDMLNRNGFEHYEISNYARPGERCRYNCNVWNGEDYLGFGPSASSRIGRMRWTHHANLDAYCQGMASGTPPSDVEELTPSMDAAERLCFRFRLRDAVNIEAFAREHGQSAIRLLPFWQDQLLALEKHGLVTRDKEGWLRTRLGARMADTIAEALIPDPA